MKKPWEETWRLEWCIGGADGPYGDDHVDSIMTDDSAQDRIVRTDCGTYTRERADLYLIAAAPDLYRALAEIESICVACPEHNEDLCPSCREPHLSRDYRGSKPYEHAPDCKLAAALTKARGQ